MVKLIALFILLLLAGYLMWIVVGLVVLVAHKSGLAKMRGSISFADSMYELTFWPVMLHRLRKFEAKDEQRRAKNQDSR